MCAQFEKALGLVWDSQVQLYTFGSSSTQHKDLISWNLTFDFQLADATGSPGSVSISVPYKAFDLQLTYDFPTQDPLPSSPTINYFPVRRATDSSQYTIGRAFLQESYLIVDYERNNFSVYQAQFGPDSATTTSLVDIKAPTDILQPSSISSPTNGTIPTNGIVPTNGVVSTNETTPGSDRSPGVNKSEIAGTVVGICVFIAGGAVLAFLCLHRSRRKSSKRNQEGPTNELPGSRKLATGSPTTRETKEIMSNPLFEMPVVKAGLSTNTPANSGQRQQASILPRGHDPNNPIELQNSGCAMELSAPNAAIPRGTESIAKRTPGDSTGSFSTASLPPYSPRHARNSTAISPISCQSSTNSRNEKIRMLLTNTLDSTISSQNTHDTRTTRKTSSPHIRSTLTTDTSNKPLPLTPSETPHTDAVTNGRTGRRRGLSTANERRGRPNYQLFSSYEAAGIPRVPVERKRMPPRKFAVAANTNSGTWFSDKSEDSPPQNTMKGRPERR